MKIDDAGPVPQLPDYMIKEPEREALAPRLVTGLQTSYEPATYNTDAGNASGLTPYGPNLLILMDVCLSVSRGGILLTDDKVEQMNEACFTGCIYEVGPDAFRGMLNRPEVGQRVYIERYAGIKVTGRDGRQYRVVDEKCIACTIADDLCVSEI